MSERVNVRETDWYKSRPAAVQRRIDEYPPTHLYRMRDTGQLVRLHAYSEGKDGACATCDTCQVVVSRRYNPGVVMERIVFGVQFANLEDTGEEAW